MVNGLINKLNNYLWKLNYWLEEYSPIYINSFNFYKLIKFWVKARKAFRFPCIECKFGKIDEITDYITEYEENKIFGLYIFDLGYKMKYGTSRFESLPQLILILFKKWKLHINFRAPAITKYSYKDNEGNILHKEYRNDMLYYEAILDYIYVYNKDILKTYNNHCWVFEWDAETCYRETIKSYLLDWAKIMCMEQDLPKLYKMYVKAILENHNLKHELNELKSKISHTTADDDNSSSGSNSEIHNNFSSGIDTQVNDLS